MFKHILGQAIYQFIILLIIIFYGDQFIPEYSDSLDDEILKVSKKAAAANCVSGDNVNTNVSSSGNTTTTTTTKKDCSLS